MSEDDLRRFRSWQEIGREIEEIREEINSIKIRNPNGDFQSINTLLNTAQNLWCYGAMSDYSLYYGENALLFYKSALTQTKTSFPDIQLPK